MYGVRRAARLAFGVVIGASVLALGCETVTVSPVPPASIEVEPRVADLITGQDEQLQAVVRDASGAPLTGWTVTWRSSDPRVATVDANGMVRAFGPGTASIVATSGQASTAAAAIVSAPGTIEISTSQVTFVAALGLEDPLPHEVQVGNGGNTELRELTVSVRYDQGATAGWLATQLAGTVAPTLLSLEARTAGLGIGRYGADVEVRDPKAGNSPEKIRVTLHVVEPLPVIFIDADSLTFSTDGPASATVTVTNAGVGTLDGLSSAVDYEGGGPIGWLSVTQTGTVAPVTITANVLPSGLGPGVYRATLRVASTVPGVAPKSIPVVLTVSPPTPRLVVRPAAVQLSAVTGSGPVNANVQVENEGSGTITSLSKAVSYGPGQPGGWLRTTLSAASTPARLDLVASAVALAPGQYDASVEISAAAPNSPQFLAVRLTVAPTAGVIPNAPTGLSAIPQSADTAVLTWVDASDNEDEFRLERSDDLGATWSRIATTPTDTTTFVDTGLAGGTTYHYRVQACNTVGCSAYGAVAVLTMPVSTSSRPKAPDDLDANAISAIDIDLDWDDNSDDETHFEVEGRLTGGTWVLIAQPSVDATYWRVTGLTPGTEYEFRVRACNPAGCSKWSNRKKEKTPDPTTVPAAPSGLAAASVTAAAVDLAWTDNSDDETAMVVQRSDGLFGTWHTVAVLPVDTTTWIDTGVSSGSFYYYRVGACNPVGCSPPSNVILVLTP